MEVAVKIFQPLSPHTAESLIREMEAFRGWNKNDRLVYNYGICTDLPRKDGDFAIIMQAAQLGDMKRFISSLPSKGRNMALAQILRIALDIADAIRFCHSQGMVHSDLKAQNVLIFDNCRAKVSDVMRPHRIDSNGHDIHGDHTAPLQHPLSSIPYMAPECLHGDISGALSFAARSATSRPSSDAYSFGVLLWELITAETPWMGKSAHQISLSHYQQESLPLPPISHRCSEALRFLLSRCLRTNPTERPTFEQIYSDIGTMLSLEGKNASSNGGVVSASSRPPESFPMVGVSLGPLQPSSDISMHIHQNINNNQNASSAPQMSMFVCPLSKEIMTDPVVINDGHSFERASIEQWLQHRDTSPITGAPLLSKQTTPNHALRAAIQVWRSWMFNVQQQQQQQQAADHSAAMTPFTGLAIPRSRGPSGPNAHSLLSDPPVAGNSLHHTGILSNPNITLSNTLGSAPSMPNLPHALTGPLMSTNTNTMDSSAAYRTISTWPGMENDDLPAVHDSNLLMSMGGVDLGLMGPAGLSRTGSASGNNLNRGGSSTLGWSSLGGLSLPSQEPLVAFNGSGNTRTQSSLDYTTSSSITLTQDDDWTEMDDDAGHGRQNTGSQSYEPSRPVNAALSPSTAEAAGRHLKSLFTRSNGGATVHCDLRNLRRLVAQWAGQADVLNWADPGDSGTAILHDAARMNHREAVRLLLATHGVNCNMQDYTGCTALRLAAQCCHVSVVRLLTAHPAVDVNIKGLDGLTALTCCKSSPKYQEIKQVLLNAEAIAASRTSNPRGGHSGDNSPTSQHRSSDSGPLDLMLSEVIAAVNKCDLDALHELAQRFSHCLEVFNHGDYRDRGNSPLLLAASDRAASKVLAFLLSLPSVQVNKTNTSGETALHLSCRHGCLDIVQQLLRVPNIDYNLADTTQGRTALMMAVKLGHREIVKLLCAVPGINIDAYDKKGINAVHLAKHSELKEMILAARARELARTGQSSGRVGMDQSNGSDSRALYGNSASGSETWIKDVQSSTAAQPNIPPEHHHLCQALFQAAKTGDLAAIQQFESDDQHLSATLAWNYPDATANNYTALHLAVSHDHPKVVKHLLKIQYVDINAVDSDNMTPAHIAVLEDRRECLKLLLTHDAIDLKKRDKNTDTPLSMCARHDRRNAAKLILAHPTVRRMINGTNPGGLTALNIACFNGFVELVKLFLASPDIDVNKPNKKSSTPLIEAVRKGKVDIVKLLLRHPKIDLTHTCNYGGDALASSSRFPEIKQILLDAYREKGVPIPDDAL